MFDVLASLSSFPIDEHVLTDFGQEIGIPQTSCWVSFNLGGRGPAFQEDKVLGRWDLLCIPLDQWAISTQHYVRERS